MRFYAAFLRRVSAPHRCFSQDRYLRLSSKEAFLASQLFAKKSIDKLISDSERPGHRLPKSLGPWSLTALGIGAIIGSGIFVLTGTAAAGEFSTPSLLHAQVLGRLSEPVSAREPFRRASAWTAAGRPGNRNLISSGGDCLQFCWSVLCRAGLDDPNCGKRLHVFLRDAG